MPRIPAVPSPPAGSDLPWSISPGEACGAPVETVFARLKSSPAGLSHLEATQRLMEGGLNELQAAKPVSAWALLAGQFANVLVVILLVATALSAVLGHATEAVVIFIIVLFAVGFGFWQEFRAERAIESLKKMAAPTATVLRDGEAVEIAANRVAPGDVLILQAGNRVAADARLIECASLHAQEAALTGESLPVAKQLAPPAEGASVGDRRNLVFAGTAVTLGRGRAVVVATGMRTEFGKIAGLLGSVETTRTPLQQTLDKLGSTLARVALVVVALIVVAGVARGQPVVEMFVFGIALAVAVVPEALPAVVTISLALGVQRLVKRRALMRRLSAVETLGCTSVICSDKTGTLTKDEMTVRTVYADGCWWTVTGAGYAPVGEWVRGAGQTDGESLLKQLLTAGVAASDATLSRDATGTAWVMKGDPTEGALVVAAAKAGVWRDAVDAALPRIHEIPFTSESKRMTTLHRRADGAVVLFAKGAPELLLPACATMRTPGGERPFDEPARAMVLAEARAMADGALRVLALAAREGVGPEERGERGLVFLGLVGMSDPPRPEAAAALEKCAMAGIRVIMITGDHPVTAEAVAREIGIATPGSRVVTGAELEAMSEPDLERDLGKIAVFARVSPAHKLRVVSALQRQGAVVAMTGDGVNDAPALKKADIGVAMGISGTDVAREAAAMTLTDDNFASIVAAVEEGRAIYGNIRKYLMFLLSSNLGEILLMVGASALGVVAPLTAVQILYINLATDGLPALALAFDPPDLDGMRRPPRDAKAGLFNRRTVALMVVAGVWLAVVALGVFGWMIGTGRSEAEARTLCFSAMVFMQLVNAYVFRSDRVSTLHRPWANRWLNLAVAWEGALLVGLLHLPFLHGPFGVTTPTVGDWAIVALAAASVIPVMELAKRVARRWA